MNTDTFLISILFPVVITSITHIQSFPIKGLIYVLLNSLYKGYSSF